MAEKSNANMLFANFNQDFSCVSVGTRKGYSITNCDPFGRVYTMNDGARGIVEMLFCTSLIALVGAADQPQSSPRKLQIVNTKRQSMICELLFPSSILAVKLNRKTLVIVLEVEIYIYDISNMRLLHIIETTPNPEVRPQRHRHHPSNHQSGDVLLFSTRTLTVANVIQAHKSPISLLSINSTGTMLATASDKGTVIRVWNIPGSEKLYQFPFNVVSSLLAVSSAHDTVHIFKLGPQKAPSSSSSKKNDGLSSPPESIDSREGSAGMDGGYEAFADERKKSGVSMSLRRNLSHSVGGYLPNTITEMWEPSRDFAFLRLPTSGARCIVALSGTLPQVMVISSEGYFYSYNIDLENGGECSLMKQYSLLDPDSAGME
ncbi:WD40 repeat-like protein [Suillus ampliporus]|nr:WD40 repeat-like protein [Suillus ampliporus]